MTYGLRDKYVIIGTDKVLPSDFRDGNPFLKGHSQEYYRIGENFFSADLSDNASADNLFTSIDGVTKVIHLAAVASRSASAKDVVTNNIEATANVFDRAIAIGCNHILYASSNGVYGIYEQEAVRDGNPLHMMERPPLFTEETPIAPADPYSVGKVWMEAYARMLSFQNTGVSFTGLRIGVVRLNDNPADINDFSTAPNIIQPAKRFEKLWLFHVDLVQLVELCLAKSKGYQIYNAISQGPGASGVYIDITKAMTGLGFQPRN